MAHSRASPASVRLTPTVLAPFGRRIDQALSDQIFERPLHLLAPGFVEARHRLLGRPGDARVGEIAPAFIKDRVPVEVHRVRCVIGACQSSIVIAALRACCVTHSAFGCTVGFEMMTRRVPTWMKNSM